MQVVRSSRFVHIAILGSLIALTLAVYGQVHDHEFVDIDDPIYIVDNPNLRAGLSIASVVQAFSEPYETNWIPLTWLSLQLDHSVFGLDPTGYHHSLKSACDYRRSRYGSIKLRTCL